MATNHAHAPPRPIEVDLGALDLTHSLALVLDPGGDTLVYARLSEKDRDDPAADDGIERRLREGMRLCEEKEWPIYGLYSDYDLSASEFSTKPRPGYEALVEVAVRRPSMRIVCLEQDRFTRNVLELGLLRRQLMAARSRAVLVTREYVYDPIRLTDPGDRRLTMVEMKAVMDGDYSRALSEKQRGKMKHLRETGHMTGHARPFGWAKLVVSDTHGRERVTWREDQS